MSSLIGVSAIAEYAGGDFDAVSIFAPVYFHPHAGCVFKIATGLAIEGNETAFGVRAGWMARVAGTGRDWVCPVV